jgi:enoyl-CoA hydratase
VSEELRVEIAERIAIVTFDRPERRNAITFEMWQDLKRLIEELDANAEVRVIVFTGAGDDAFSAGADISQFETHRNNAEQAAVYNAAFDAAMDAAEAAGKPTIAMIKGACVGGGFEFSSACDLRIGAENARFGVPIARLGLPIAYREMRRVIRAIGHAKTMELLFSAALLTAEDAHRLGYLNHVLPLADVEPFTLDLARRIAALAPLVHRVHKRIATTVLEDPSLEGLTEADHAYALSPYDTEDFQEGWRAFLEKRDPEFHGR